jgi:signal transduction histidine kinase
MFIPKSIRWRLPLSYAAIALLAAVALGAVLLTVLRGYYAQREYDHLRGNAETIAQTVSEMYYYQLPDELVEAQLESLAFLAQARIRVLDADGQPIADSGDSHEPRIIALSYNPQQPPPDVIYQFESATPGEFAGSRTGVWNASINVFPRIMPSRLTVRADEEKERQFVMAVAGTPYGFGLNARSDVRFDRRSDQKIVIPLMDVNNQIVRVVELLDGPAYGTEIVDGVARALAMAGFIAVVLSATVGWLISRHITRPLLTLAKATQHMAEGDLSVRVTTRRQDEYGLLGEAFNHMAGRVENTVTTLRRFVADAAHEIHTPITALHANLELAATETNPAQQLAFIHYAQEQLKRLETMTSSLLDLSRIEAGEAVAERTSLDLVDLVSEVSELYASKAEQTGLTFQFDTPAETIIASVNEAQMRRVIGNLLDNAIKFTPENGIVRVGLRREGKIVRLWVQDTGIGIPAEDLPHLFSRFRRGRNAAAYPGNGLGLAIIKAIVEGHGGQVTVESSTSGTQFLLQLPAAA